MSLTRIGPHQIGIDGLLITAPGAAVRLDSAVPGRRPVEAPRRRRQPHDEDPPAGEQDTVTLHPPDADEEGEPPDPVEALRRGGFRRHA
jgi:hypothetical protein